MSKWTPGPWRWIQRWNECNKMPILVTENFDEKASMWDGKQDDKFVCGFGDDEDYYPSQGIPPNEADAQLIKAAPLLAEALILVLRDAEAEWGTSVCECLGEAPDDMMRPDPCSYCIAREALHAAGVEE